MRDPLALAREQEAWRLGRCLNLIASENVTSPQVRSLLASDFGHRYTLPFHGTIHGIQVENAYMGTRYADAVEALGEDLARRLLGADYASLKPLSGHLSAFTLLAATCRPGDTVLVVDPRDGGYDGYGRDYLPRTLGLQADFLPFDRGRWNVATEEACRQIEATRPRLVILGASLLLFPYDLPPIRQACDAAGSLLAYDGSHVLGLLLAGRFQRPFAEGVDVVVGSTHKSLFGPQGGLLAARASAQPLFPDSTWRAQDNAHWHRIAALAQALREVEAFGAAYADAVLRNARALARALHKEGLAVRLPERGHTRSPQLLLDPGPLEEGFGLTPPALAQALERNDVIVDAVGRLGTNELTRMGATEADMGAVAEAMVAAARGEDVREAVAQVRGRLRLAFCFEE